VFSSESSLSYTLPPRLSVDIPLASFHDATLFANIANIAAPLFWK
jgi:hypothetical protein